MLDLDKTLKSIPFNQSSTSLALTPIQPTQQTNNLCFIDGGSSEIISSPHCSLQIIKTIALFVSDNKISNIEIGKHIVLIQVKDQGFQISETGNPTFLLKTSKDIHETGNIIRNLKELQFYHKTQQTSKALTVKDGTFTSETQEEKYIISQLTSLCGLAKSSNDVYNNISPLSSLNQQPGPYYTKLANYYYVKLNKFSNYTFKLQIKNIEIEPTLQQLISNSKDYIYPGYPYGLILADRFARISNQQTEYLKAYIQTKMQHDWKKIQSWENSINAHQILDKLSFGSRQF